MARDAEMFTMLVEGGRKTKTVMEKGGRGCTGEHQQNKVAGNVEVGSVGKEWQGVQS